MTERMQRRLRRSALWVLMTAVAGQAAGQGVATVTGLVSNESGRRLEHALVTLDPDGANRQARTDAEGRYSFIGVAAGTHTLRVAWVGFAPETRTVNVTPGTVTVDFTLRRLTVLDTVAVQATRTGIYGTVISKDSLLPVPGAVVEVIGARKSAATDSSGGFSFPEIQGGSYIVRVKHPWFESRNFTAVVPVKGGTGLDVVVERGRISRDQHMEMLYREMDSRLAFRGTNTAFVTREELRGREAMSLDKALAFAPDFAKKSLYVTSDVCLYVDGVARPGATIQDFKVEEIEAIELYGAPYRDVLGNAGRALRMADPTGTLGGRWPPRAPCGMPPSPTELRTRPQTVVKVMFAAVWLKR